MIIVREIAPLLRISKGLLNNERKLIYTFKNGKTLKVRTPFFTNAKVIQRTQRFRCRVSRLFPLVQWGAVGRRLAFILLIFALSGHEIGRTGQCCSVRAAGERMHLSFGGAVHLKPVGIFDAAHRM